jgi:aminoglycoside phosphotransferase (APT) family kinase protein
VLDAWQPLWGRLAAGGYEQARVLGLLARGVERVTTLQALRQATPMTLCHGDCHIGNLLYDAGDRLVWADWQEVGIGRGPDDLSFLLQRAVADGASVPETSLLAAYRDELIALTGTSLTLKTLQGIMDAFELRTRLLEWPPYLAMGDDRRIAAHVARIEQILSRS